MKQMLVLLLFFLVGNQLRAQMNGIVYGSDHESKKEILVGAKLYLLHDKTGVISSKEGKFELTLPKELPDTLIISAMGYYPDTLIVTKKDRFSAVEIVLFSDQLIPEVVVQAKRETTSILRLKVLQVEEITSGELRKAACCNLSESFETNASVDVNFTDAVSGAKQIQMMGLDGVYTQIQTENIPSLRGLESSFGLNSIPGTWINSIQITKGSGNVVNGYESMAGLINLELKKPMDMERMYFNGYVNRFGRSELNFNSGFKLNEKWSSGWFLHGALIPLKMDGNNDGFRDFPTGSTYALLNRYHYQGEKMEAQFGVNAYLDDKLGGQMTYRKGDSTAYGVPITTKHIDAFAKTGFFLKRKLHSIGVVYNAKYQTLDARFGNRAYQGEEQRAYVNAIYDGIIGTTLHKFKIGGGGVYADFKQQLDSLNDDRTEFVPGIFGEYTYGGPRMSLVAGIRTDYHNLFGWQVSPRLHAKYSLTEKLDFRATVGKGWRVPNYQVDNISLLATSRNWVAPDTVRPEISWNAGGSLSYRFKMFKRKGTITADFYHTFFETQLLVDRDADPTKLVFDYSDKPSYSNSFQVEASYALTPQLDIRAAYKWLEVKAEYGGKLQQKAMVPSHRGFLNLAYKTRNKRWEYDVTGSVFGKSRLPVNYLPDGTLTMDNFSQIFPLVNAQITHTYRKWEFYLGGENLLNYRQKNPIIDAQNPFGAFFDATRIWAPIMGTNVYLGFRWSIEQKNKN